MRINTAKSIALGERLHKAYGSWAEVLRAAELRDGVYVIRDLPKHRETDDRGRTSEKV